MMSSKTQIQPVAENSSRALIFYLLCVGFVLNGIIITFIGAILPVFRAKWGLDDSHAGLFSTTQFAFSLAGVLVSSPLIARKGFKPAITLGLAMQGIGFALLNAPTFVLALAASAIYGLGYGFVTPGTNLWVGESYGDRRASALNISNLAWGIGALASAPLAKWAMQSATLTQLLYVTGAVSTLLAIVLLRMRFGEAPKQAAEQEAAEPSGAAGHGIVALLGVLFFVYVGTEVSTSYWSVTHTQRAATWAGNNFTFAQMFFFSGLLGGRGASAAILLRLKEGTVAVGGLLLAAAGEILFLSGHSPTSLFAGALLAGLGLSSLYPIYIAWLSKWFGTRARKVGGILFALAAAGASTMPALVGVVSSSAGSLRIGLFVPVAGCAVMLTVVALLRPNSRH
jgi:fucose permease